VTATTGHSSAADRAACWILRVGETSARGDIYNAFSSSIALSGARCLLTYVLLPLAGGLGALPRVGPYLGLPLGAVALVFDVRAIRRFFQAKHRWRWAAAALYLAVMAMVSGLMSVDVSHLA